MRRYWRRRPKGRRKIILHIGLPKTGTTTIQNVLHANRESLLEQEGVLYPSLAPNLTTPLCTIFLDNPRKHIANKMADLTAEEVAGRREDYLDSLDDEISSREWDTLLLSAEGVSNLSASELAKLREWGERYSSKWTVLVCVRHPVDYVRSVIQQLMKGGDTLQQLYEKLPMPNYRGKISNAISVFGRENVRVFDFNATTESGDGIVGTFATQAGLTAATRDLLTSRAVRDNESLSSEAVRVLDALNRQRPMFDGNVRAPRRPNPGQELAYVSRIRGRKFDVPNPVKEDIRRRGREDIAWLNETFGLDLYRDVADFVPRAEDSEEPVEALSDPAIDGIAEVLGELITTTVFRRSLDQGKVALTQGNLERAEAMLREAERLNPDAPQPKKLLKEVAARQTVGFTDA